MKRLAVLLASLAFAGSVAAGSFVATGEKDPHHGLKGGCSSKDKVARMKKLYGDDWAKQVPGHAFKQEAQASTVEPAQRKIPLDRFI